VCCSTAQRQLRLLLLLLLLLQGSRFDNDVTTPYPAASDALTITDHAMHYAPAERTQYIIVC